MSPKSRKPRLPETRFSHEPVWVHFGLMGAGCGGPVYFELNGGHCYQCGTGPLTTLEYTHQRHYDGRDWPAKAGAR